MGVDKTHRGCGIGTLLGKEYTRMAVQQRLSEIVLRTDEGNEAAMALYAKLGFSEIVDGKRKIYDPRFPNRIYLRRRVS